VNTNRASDQKFTIIDMLSNIHYVTSSMTKDKDDFSYTSYYGCDTELNFKLDLYCRRKHLKIRIIYHLMHHQMTSLLLPGPIFNKMVIEKGKKNIVFDYIAMSRVE